MSQSHGLKNAKLSYGLVALQFGFVGILLYLLFIQTPYQFHWLAAGFQGAAILLALAAFVHLQKGGMINIIPDPKANRSLVTSGPYHYIRHPMYSSILLFFVPTISVQATPDLMLTLILLTLTLLHKLHYEEQLLSKDLFGYKHYQHESKKLIPFIY